MKTTQFTEAQIVSILRQHEKGFKVTDITRSNGISGKGCMSFHEKRPTSLKTKIREDFGKEDCGMLSSIFVSITKFEKNLQSDWTAFFFATPLKYADLDYMLDWVLKLFPGITQAN